MELTNYTIGDNLPGLTRDVYRHLEEAEAMSARTGRILKAMSGKPNGPEKAYLNRCGRYISAIAQARRTLLDMLGDCQSILEEG